MRSAHSPIEIRNVRAFTVSQLAIRTFKYKKNKEKEIDAIAFLFASGLNVYLEQTKAFLPVGNGLGRIQIFVIPLNELPPFKRTFL